MSLFSGQINQVQGDVQQDITKLGEEESCVITAAVASFKGMLQELLDGYTIEIKAVKK